MQKNGFQKKRFLELPSLLAIGQHVGESTLCNTRYLISFFSFFSKSIARKDQHEKLLYTRFSYECSPVCHLRTSINNKMRCMQKSLLLFQRTSRNRNAPPVPRLVLKSHWHIQGWQKHKGLCKIYRMENPPDPSIFPFPCFICIIRVASEAE